VDDTERVLGITKVLERHRDASQLGFMVAFRTSVKDVSVDLTLCFGKAQPRENGGGHADIVRPANQRM